MAIASPPWTKNNAVIAWGATMNWSIRKGAVSGNAGVIIQGQQLGKACRARIAKAGQWLAKIMALIHSAPARASGPGCTGTHH